MKLEQRKDHANQHLTCYLQNLTIDYNLPDSVIVQLLAGQLAEWARVIEQESAHGR